jgi:hypothetical protein
MAQRLPVILPSHQKFGRKKRSLIFSDAFFDGGKNKRIFDKNKEEMSVGFHLFCCQAILPRLFKIKYRQVSFSPKNIQIHRRHKASLCVPLPADGSLGIFLSFCISPVGKYIELWQIKNFLGVSILQMVGRKINIVLISTVSS